jgi:hypothetical protein
MKSRALTTTLATLALAALGGLATTACSKSVSPELTEAASSTQALVGTGGGHSLGYTCTPAGACQCSGIEDCSTMSREVCKADWYCNDDKYGHRCICLNFLPLKAHTPPVRPVSGGSAATR